MLELSEGPDTVAVDLEAGARLASLVAGGAERLVGRPDDPQAPRLTSWGCFVMAPWAGRLSRAQLPWEGRYYPLEANLPPHAIHGVVFDELWTVERAGDSEAQLVCRLDPGRWPLGGTARQRIALGNSSLRLEIEVTAGDRAMPVAAGWHPWFRRPERGDMRAQVSSQSVLVTDDELIPTGGLAPVRGDTDLRDGPPLGARRLDHVYVDSTSPALVVWPDLEMTMSFEPPLHTVVVYTPAEGLCVEPQTAWPDAPRLRAAGVEGTGLAVLGAGETFTARTTWSWRPA